MGLSFLVATSHNAQMLIEPDHNIKWNITYTSPMNHRQDRCWNPDQETNYPLGFNKPVKSTTRMTRNLFHIWYLSDVRVSRRKSWDWGRHRWKEIWKFKYEEHTFLFMYNKSPTQHFNKLRAPSRQSLRND